MERKKRNALKIKNRLVCKSNFPDFNVSVTSKSKLTISPSKPFWSFSRRKKYAIFNFVCKYDILGFFLLIIKKFSLFLLNHRSNSFFWRITAFTNYSNTNICIWTKKTQVLIERDTYNYRTSALTESHALAKNSSLAIVLHRMATVRYSSESLNLVGSLCVWCMTMRAV